MTQVIGDSIVSALGFGSEENFEQVRAGVSGLRLYDDLPEAYMASVIDDGRLEREFTALEAKQPSALLSKLEKAATVSVARALERCNVDAASEKTHFIISTTKGNIAFLNPDVKVMEAYISHSAAVIAEFFGNRNTPLVVSNACISGASAVIAASRELKSQRFDNVIVVGVDVLSQFVISGFQSFKALSQSQCKPFDVNHSGLNIGEAAATVILSEQPDGVGSISFTAGASRNDANHISGPSRTGEGSYLSLQAVTAGIEVSEIAFINAHGTATQYNDEMEAVALTRAGLQNVPVNSLKGYFGHTLGAAGILESIISMYALKHGLALATFGCDTPLLTNPLQIITETQPVEGRRFVKMLSGFGGSNAALLFTLER